MHVSQQVLIAIEDGVRATNGRADSALLHACLAMDGTARQLYPGKGVAERYIQIIRDYMWLIEPMIGGGINLIDTRFDNVKIQTQRRFIQSPDFAEIIYYNFRCNLAHGEEIPQCFMVTIANGSDASAWYLGPDRVHMPNRLIWALLSVVVFCRVNKGIRTMGDHVLTFQNHVFPISKWWGREDEVRSLFISNNAARVILTGLGDWPT